MRVCVCVCFVFETFCLHIYVSRDCFVRDSVNGKCKRVENVRTKKGKIFQDNFSTRVSM